MSQEELNNLRKLSRKQLQVLRLICQRHSHKEIEQMIGMPIPTIKTHMSRIYVTLGLQYLEKSARIATIHQVYCPLMKDMEFSIVQPPKTSSRTGHSPENTNFGQKGSGKVNQADTSKPVEDEIETVIGEFIDESETPQPETPIPDNVRKMVDDDENYIIKYQPPVTKLVDPRPRQSGRRTVLIGSAIGVIVGVGLCLCIVFSMGFLYWNQNKAQFASSPNQPAGQPTQPQDQVINPTEPPQVIVVTATSLPEANPAVPAPTSAPVVVPTAVSGPVIPLPFSDNFDNGPSQYWKVLSGTWITADGRYTTTTPDTWSIVALDDPTWKNYHVHVNVKIPHIGSAAEGQIAIFVRINTSPYLGFGDNALSKAYWGNQAQGGIYLVPIAGESKVYIQGNSNMDIEVNGNNFTARIDGQQVQKFSMSGYETGGIALGIHCNTNLGCESFDNVTVDPLP